MRFLCRSGASSICAGSDDLKSIRLVVDSYAAPKVLKIALWLLGASCEALRDTKQPAPPQNNGYLTGFHDPSFDPIILTTTQ